MTSPNNHLADIKVVGVGGGGVNAVNRMIEEGLMGSNSLRLTRTRRHCCFRTLTSNMTSAVKRPVAWVPEPTRKLAALPPKIPSQSWKKPFVVPTWYLSPLERAAGQVPGQLQW